MGNTIDCPFYVQYSLSANRVFCFPCILYRQPQQGSPWFTPSLGNVKGTKHDIESHGRGQKHKLAYSQWKHELAKIISRDDRDGDRATALGGDGDGVGEEQCVVSAPETHLPQSWSLKFLEPKSRSRKSVKGFGDVPDVGAGKKRIRGQRRTPFEKLLENPGIGDENDNGDAVPGATKQWDLHWLSMPKRSRRF